MRVNLFRFFLLLNLIICSVSAFGDQIIVQKGQAKADILIEEDANSQIRRAAKILQDYIRKSTNVELKIKHKPDPSMISIYIGGSNFSAVERESLSKLRDDGYMLKTINIKTFLIIGKTDWGTEFGVYEFLERFVGVRWLMPTDLGVDILATVDLIIPSSNVLESPIYLSRSLSPINIENNSSVDIWGRFNRAKKNMEFHHNLNKLFNDKALKKTNPNFFSTFSVNRSVPVGSNYKWQPNFSAPGIADTAANRIIKYFAKNPRESSYSLGMNDSGNFDTSPTSKKRRNGKVNALGFEDISDDYFSWANEVTKKVNKVYPDKKIGVLAYRNLYDPPSKRIGVNSNIVPFITFERIKWSNSISRSADIASTRNWTEQTSEVGWYDYCYGLCYLTPRVWFHTMQDYLKWGSENNVKYYYGELYPNWGEGPKAWVLTKLLWNPNQDVDKLLNEWYIRFAGKIAGAKLKEYYGLWENYWQSDIQKSNWFDPEGKSLKYNDLGYMANITPEMINKSDRLLQEAYQLADSSTRKKRVLTIMKMWDVYKEAYHATKKYKAKYLPTLRHSVSFMKALNALKEDSIHNNSLKRILVYVDPIKK